MAKRALCVGTNRYAAPGIATLNGCVNDAHAWAELLINHYDFPASDVAFLIDDQATKQQVLAGLKALMAGATAGDTLVFVNASHGSLIADLDDDEPDGVDEVLCTYDYGAEALIDDDLREILANLSRRVRLTVISDSCHSGTLLRDLPIQAGAGNRPVERTTTAESAGLQPLTLRALARLDQAAARRREAYPESEMRELLLSGCMASETSKEDVFDGVCHGAMTATALRLINAANYDLTYQELHKRLTDTLGASVYQQRPQLEGTDANKRRRLFS